MGYIPSPPRVLPPNASEEDRRKLYREYRAELVEARNHNAKMFAWSLNWMALVLGLALLLFLILRFRGGLS